MNVRRFAAAAAGVLLLTGAAAACSDDESVFNAEVGECIKELDDLGGEISSLPETECTEDHEGEFFALFEHEGDDDDFDEDRVGEEANEACLDEFEDYMGVEPTETRITFAPITPSEESWKDGNDRETICVAFIPDETVDESFEDAGEDFPLEGADPGDSGDSTDDTTGDAGDDDDVITPGSLSDEEVASLIDDCEGGDNKACDDLYFGTNVGTPEEEIGATCGGRSDEELNGFCENELG